MFNGSLWLHQCQHPFRYAHAQAGENPELRTLFFRLARLLRLCVAVLFVFDGSGRPSLKRGKQVIKQEHWLATPFREMIEAFGFDCHTVCVRCLFYLCI
jgi:Holliday junction resolvase YEN1